MQRSAEYLRLIKYLKSIVGLDIEDALRVIVGLLKGEGKHSAIEGQAKYIYQADMVFNPKKLKGLGYCPQDCDECLNWRFLKVDV